MAFLHSQDFYHLTTINRATVDVKAQISDSNEVEATSEGDNRLIGRIFFHRTCVHLIEWVDHIFNKF